MHHFLQTVTRAGYALIEAFGGLRTAVVEVYAMQTVSACQLKMAVQHYTVVPLLRYFVKQLAAFLYACTWLTKVKKVYTMGK